MKKFLCVLALCLSLATSLPANAPFGPLEMTVVNYTSNIKSEDLNLIVQDSIKMLVKHYVRAMRSAGLSAPKIQTINVVVVDNFFGVYLGHLPGPSLLINAMGIEDHVPAEYRHAALVYVITHELGHHLLQAAGMPGEDQHHFMYCKVDWDLAKEIGYPLNPMMILRYCF